MVIGGKRLPAIFVNGRIHPQDFPEARVGGGRVPIENGLHVSFYADGMRRARTQAPSWPRWWSSPGKGEHLGPGIMD